MSEQSRDALSHSWWPGQWLRIVYGVWVDQLWYWQNVRPRLGRSQPRRWLIFAQGVMGSALATLSLSMLAGGLLTVAGIGVDWERLVAGALVGVVSGTVIGIASRAVGLGITAALSLPWGLITAATGSMSPGPIELYVGALAWGLGLGLAIEVADGATTGTVYTLTRRDGVLVLPPAFVLIAVIVSLRAYTSNRTAGLAQATQTGAAVSLVAIVGAAVGLYIGRRWIEPRIPDAETRRRLLGIDTGRAE